MHSHSGAAAERILQLKIEHHDEFRHRFSQYRNCIDTQTNRYIRYYRKPFLIWAARKFSHMLLESKFHLYTSYVLLLYQGTN